MEKMLAKLSRLELILLTVAATIVTVVVCIVTGTVSYNLLKPTPVASLTPTKFVFPPTFTPNAEGRYASNNGIFSGNAINLMPGSPELPDGFSQTDLSKDGPNSTSGILNGCTASFANKNLDAAAHPNDDYLIQVKSTVFDSLESAKTGYEADRSYQVNDVLLAVTQTYLPGKLDGFEEAEFRWGYSGGSDPNHAISTSILSYRKSNVAGYIAIIQKHHGASDVSAIAKIQAETIQKYARILSEKIQ